jgi:hypothetical protein
MGQLTMSADLASVRLLYSALGQVARKQDNLGNLMLISGGDKGFSFDTVNGIYSLPDALQVLNSALLAHRETSLRVMCSVYGDSREVSAPRLYRFSIAYDVPMEVRADKGSGWPEREIWILFSLHHEHDVLAEVAWQRYIQSWGRLLEIRQESLSDGLSILLDLLNSQGYNDATPVGKPVLHLTGPFAPKALGRVVREAWVRRYSGRANPKKEHLFPYDDISSWDQETDDLIGMDLLLYIFHHRGDYLLTLLMNECAVQGIQLPPYERMKELMQAIFKGDVDPKIFPAFDHPNDSANHKEE